MGDSEAVADSPKRTQRLTSSPSRTAFVLELLREEAAGGIVLTAALALAVIVATTAPGLYAGFVGHPLSIWSVPSSQISDVASLITNGAMIAFFAAVGLEIGRERADGALADRSTAILPVVAALGGMAAAAGVYAVTVLLLGVHGALGGWGIPMATDVAFTLGALTLIGGRASLELRVFLLTLAVADDVASVLVLAATGDHGPAVSRLTGATLVAGVAAVIAVTLLARRRRAPWPVFAGAGLCLWWLLAQLGIEPTLAGVVIGVMVPTGHAVRSPGITLERAAVPLSTFLILPLFALVAGGVNLSAQPWTGQSGLMIAILAARSLGKFLGITGGVLLALRFGLGRLPRHTSLRQMVGASLLCGIGFTVPLLFANKAFAHAPHLLDATKVGLLVASLLCAVVGLVIMAAPSKNERRGE